eukprot:1157203-Pelagomonas_calceolata.AAC.6
MSSKKKVILQRCQTAGVGHSHEKPGGTPANISLVKHQRLCEKGTATSWRSERREKGAHDVGNKVLTTGTKAVQTAKKHIPGMFSSTNLALVVNSKILTHYFALNFTPQNTEPSHLNPFQSIEGRLQGEYDH